MGWGVAKSNLRNLFGTGPDCPLVAPDGPRSDGPGPDDPGSAGGRLEAEGFVMSVALAVFVVASCLF